MTEGVLASSLSVALDRVSFARQVGLEPDDWQRRLLSSTHPRIILNCHRQSGKSTMAALMALHRALYHPGSLVLIVAPSERQAGELFGKVSQVYGQLGYPVDPLSDRKLGVLMSNGSRIEALPGKEKTIRGFSGVDLLIVDEGGRVEDDLYYAVRPMLAVSGGRLMLLSTPFGHTGFFYEEWTEGVGWERFEVPVSQNPRISPEFLREERRSLGDWFFSQEYMCRFERSISSVFDVGRLRQAVNPDRPRLFAREA
jgi:Terminase large subunit, T4likevirus-type, N-terminal